MKQVVTKVLVGASLVVAVASFLWFVGQPRFSCSPDPVKVAYGDTLWAIAERECEGEISFVVDFLVGQYGTTIHAGQLVWLPLDYDDATNGDW